MWSSIIKEFNSTLESKTKKGRKEQEENYKSSGLYTLMSYVLGD